MGRINAVPEGLLDLLRSKTDGRTPADLAEVVSPVLDLGPMYFGERLDFQGTTIAPYGLGATLSITVPQTEVWVLLGWSLFMQSINAGQSGRVSWRLANLPGSGTTSATIIGASDWGYQTGTTTGLQTVLNGPTFPMAGPAVVLNGGMRIDVRHDNFEPNAAANPSAAMYVNYYRSSR